MSTDTAEESGTNYKNMRVPEEDWEVARTVKQELGLDWGTFLQEAAVALSEQDLDESDGLSEEDVRTIAGRVVEDKVVDGALR